MNKTFDYAEVKAVDVEAGELSGYAAVFGNVDMQNDMIMPGAFKESISDFISSGHLCCDHNWQARVGFISDAREDSRGLFFKAKFYSTKLAREALQEVRERFKAGRKIALSIGFNVAEAVPLKNGVRAIKKARLFEVSIVSFGANELAAVTGLKSVEELEAQQRWRDEMIGKMFAGIFSEQLNGMHVRFRRNALQEMAAKSRRNALSKMATKVKKNG